MHYYIYYCYKQPRIINSLLSHTTNTHECTIVRSTVEAIATFTIVTSTVVAIAASTTVISTVVAIAAFTTATSTKATTTKNWTFMKVNNNNRRIAQSGNKTPSTMITTQPRAFQVHH